MILSSSGRSGPGTSAPIQELLQMPHDPGSNEQAEVSSAHAARIDMVALPPDVFHLEISGGDLPHVFLGFPSDLRVEALHGAAASARRS